MTDTNRLVEKTFSRKVRVTLTDEVHCIVSGLHPDHVNYFVDEHAYHVDGYFFQPKYKLGIWDGKARFFSEAGNTYVNLLDKIIPQIKHFGYGIELNDKRQGEFATIDPVDEDYFSHITDPKTNLPYKIRPYQVDAVNALTDPGSGIVIAGTGAGKAQPLSSKVLTPNGWVSMGEIAVGSTVVTPIGTMSTVVGVYPQGVKKIYEITFHDGSKTKSCAEHLWKVYRPKKLWRGNTQEDIVNTQYIIDFLKIKESKQRHVPGNITIPLVDPVPGTVKDLPMDPYLIGVLIGDGSLSNGSTMFSSKDDSLIAHITKTVKLLYDLDVTNSNSNGTCDYRIINTHSKDTFPPQKNILTEIVRVLNLNVKSCGKFIPQMYKDASIEQRWEVIRGLMDTDGTVDKRGNISFTTVSEQLAYDVQEMCWSLGSTATISTRTPSFTYKGEKKEGQLAYTVFIRHPKPTQFFRLERKKQRCRALHGDGRIQLGRRVVSVVEVDEQPAQCIMIDDEDHLYITDDYIVTHNTVINSALIDLYGKQGLNTLTIVPSVSLVQQTKNTFEFLGLDVGEYSGTSKDLNHTHIVSTWQTLQNNPKVIKQFQVVVVDECHGAKATVIKQLLNEYGRDIVHRFGLTGTLPKNKADNVTILLSIGDVKYTIAAHTLITAGWLATPNITVLQLNDQKRLQDLLDQQPPDEAKKITYDNEITFQRQDTYRRQWIADFIIEKGAAHQGNVLCLVNNVPVGKKLSKMIPGSIFLHGTDDQAVRQAAYDTFEHNNDVIVIATVQIAGVGLSIDRIFNLIFIDGGKSYVRTIQSIGRGLRKGKDKNSVDIVDLCGNLDHARKHLSARTKFYKESQYKFKKIQVNYS